MKSLLMTWLVALYCSLFVHNIYAEPYPDEALKPWGVSLEWYQHDVALDVVSHDLAIPGVPSEVVDGVVEQLAVNNTAKILNLQVDYQFSPFLNVFGSLGKVTDDTNLAFSGLGLGLSDMDVDNDGTAYTIGANLQKTYGKWVPSVRIFHSRIDQQNNDEDVKITGMVPELGLITDWGVFNAGLLYQVLEADYSGTVTAPVIGELPVNVDTEFAEKIQIMAGYHTQLGRDLYLNISAGLNGEKQFRAVLNHRF